MAYDGYDEEAHCFNRSLGSPPARERMARFLEIGGQTRSAELDLGALLERMGR